MIIDSLLDTDLYKFSMMQLVLHQYSAILRSAGTRRRYSRAWQEEVVTALRDGLGAQLAGTSNV